MFPFPPVLYKKHCFSKEKTEKKKAERMVSADRKKETE
jgi:hypothetical protein